MWLVAAIGVAILHSAPAVAAEPWTGTVETGLHIPSALLGRDIPYALYLPGSAYRDAGQLPVLYLLHGRDDDERAWLDKGHIADTLDRLMRTEAIKPVAVVLPMAGNSWYVDDARGNRGFGPVATALAEDFIPAVERNHHLSSCRGRRAVAGLSMGGFGAVVQAFTHPEMFHSAVTLSGSLFSEIDADIAARMPFAQRVLVGIYGEPFDADRFKAWTAFRRLAGAAPAVKDLGVWIAAGDRDFAAGINGSVRLHLELRQRGIESHLRIYDGDHTWPLWSMAIEPALIWLSARTADGC